MKNSLLMFGSLFLLLITLSSVKGQNSKPQFLPVKVKIIDSLLNQERYKRNLPRMNYVAQAKKLTEKRVQTIFDTISKINYHQIKLYSRAILHSGLYVDFLGFALEDTTGMYMRNQSENCALLFDKNNIEEQCFKGWMNSMDHRRILLSSEQDSYTMSILQSSYGIIVSFIAFIDQRENQLQVTR